MFVIVLSFIYDNQIRYQMMYLGQCRDEISDKIQILPGRSKTPIYVKSGIISIIYSDIQI